MAKSFVNIYRERYCIDSILKIFSFDFFGYITDVLLEELLNFIFLLLKMIYFGIHNEPD